MARFALLLAVALAGIAVSCGSNPVDSRPNVIMPLAVGNMWIGKVTGPPVNGIVTITYDTITVVATERLGDETWYRLNTGKLLRNRPAGLCSLACSNTCENLQLKYPAGRGDTFETGKQTVLNAPVPTVATVGATVLAVDTAVTTPAGQFNCCFYEPKIFTPPGLRFSYYSAQLYAPNIGPVVLLGFHGASSRWELVSYTLR